VTTTESGARPHRAVDAVEPQMVEVLRGKSPAERIEIAASLWRHARQLLEWRLRSTHPECTAEERDRLIAERLAHGSW
jgi:hypothetical protein